MNYATAPRARRRLEEMLFLSKRERMPLLLLLLREERDGITFTRVISECEPPPLKIHGRLSIARQGKRRPKQNEKHSTREVSHGPLLIATKLESKARLYVHRWIMKVPNQRGCSSGDQHRLSICLRLVKTFMLGD
jgi:hypothetical protein